MTKNEQRSSSTDVTLPLGRAWLVLLAVVIADVMDFIDSSIANLAGPAIRADLGGGAVTLQWVLSAYTAAFALGLIVSGRLGDILGRRRLFLIGMVGFTLSSLACGLAPAPVVLIAARLLQGLFGATMIPQGFALVKIAFPPKHLRRALIPFGPIMGLAGVLGPILAGWLIGANLFGSQWRAIFLINVPIGIAALVLASVVLPRHAAEDPSLRIDVRGVTLLTAASALLIVPLVQGREAGWPLWAYLMMLGAVIALILFVYSERHTMHPVITPSVLRKRSFVIGLVIVASFFSALTGFTLAFNLLLQLGLRWSALHAGLTLIPWALGSAVGTILAGAVLAARLGRKTLHIGLGLAVVGMIWLGVTIAVTPAPSSFDFVPALLVGGLGTGMVFIPLFDYILGDATAEEAGTGSGLLNAVQQFASAIGAAGLGTVFFSLAVGTAATRFATATEVVVGLAAAMFTVTFALVWQLPRRLQHDSESAAETSPSTDTDLAQSVRA